MGNYLKMADKRQVLALLELGWSYRRIQCETGVDRETVARYDPCRKPKSAKVPTGSYSKPARAPIGSVSVCEPYRSIIEAAVIHGLSAQRIWQDLREDYRFSHGYCSVKRFVHKIKRRRPEVVAKKQRKRTRYSVLRAPCSLFSSFSHSPRWAFDSIIRLVCKIT